MEQNMTTDKDDFQTDFLDPRTVRRTYLVTYSQADLTKVPTRKDFAKLVKNAFNSGTGKIKVLHWACCLEEHQNHGKHYHLSIKLSGAKRWKKVKDDINQSHNIVLNFSDKHDNYYSAYKYVCKSDNNVCHSKHHPNLKNIASPVTKKPTQALRAERKRKSLEKSIEPPQKSTCSKPNRITNAYVGKFIISNNIKRVLELMSIAKTRSGEGQEDLANFIYSRSEKSLEDLIETTWKMHNSTAIITREQAKRIDVMRNFLNQECIEGCDKLWYNSAIEVLNNNNIHPYMYAEALRELLIHGRGKARNFLIIGPANCAKTFLLKPLALIFKAFQNPAKDKYAWVGVDEAEVIILQDFRWSSELISWNNLLLLLEGENVNLPAPKNHFAKDICINSDIPLFATSIGPIECGNPGENYMMKVRWKTFQFTHEIPLDEQIKMSACGRCFAELTFLGESS